jgi:hypothetical protein
VKELSVAAPMLSSSWKRVEAGVSIVRGISVPVDCGLHSPDLYYD